MQECRSQTVERALKVFPKGRGCASEVQEAQVCEERWELKIAQLGVDISLHSKNARNRGQSMKKNQCQRECILCVECVLSASDWP